jgi:hypothetical protein
MVTDDVIYARLVMSESGLDVNNDVKVDDILDVFEDYVKIFVLNNEVIIVHLIIVSKQEIELVENKVKTKID